jgi:hypothetical protein
VAMSMWETYQSHVSPATSIPAGTSFAAVEARRLSKLGREQLAGRLQLLPLADRETSNHRCLDDENKNLPAKLNLVLVLPQGQ